MPRMTGKDEPVEVQIILASGKTLDFKANLGDKIAMSHVQTSFDKKGKEPHEYYTVTLVEGQKGEI